MKKTSVNKSYDIGEHYTDYIERCYDSDQDIDYYNNESDEQHSDYIERWYDSDQDIDSNDSETNSDSNSEDDSNSNSDSNFDTSIDIKQYRKKYYQENREQILERYKEDVQCPDCLRTVRRQNLIKHMATNLCANTQKMNKLLKKTKKTKKQKD